MTAGRSDRLLVVAAALCAAVGGFDLSGVNVVLPRIATDFDVSAGVVQWVAIGYLLPIAALALPVGRWLDLVGRRPAVVLLVVGFAVLSLAAAAAPTLPLLLVARVVQGAFGAGMFAIAPVVAFAAVPPHRRAAAVGVVSAIGSMGGIAGPSLGAFVAEAVGWRAIFWIGVPVLLLALVVLATRIPDRRPLRAPSGRIVAEGVLLGSGSLLALLGFTFAADGSPAWLLLVLVLPPLLALWRRSQPDAPALQLLRRPGFGAGVGALAALAAVVLAAQYLLAFTGERMLGLSATTTGAALLAVPAAAAVSGLVAARVARHGRPGGVAVAGFLLMGAGCALGPVVPGFLLLLLASVAIGAGQGLANTPVTHFCLAFAGDGTGGSTGAVISLFRNIGFTFGPAAASLVWGLAGYSRQGMGPAYLAVAALAVGGGALVLLAAAGQRAAAAVAP